MSEIVVDNFAGGGGASTGIEMAIGRSVDIAINHDPAAIAMHRANPSDNRALSGGCLEGQSRQGLRGAACGAGVVFA